MPRITVLRGHQFVSEETKLDEVERAFRSMEEGRVLRSVVVF